MRDRQPRARRGVESVDGEVEGVAGEVMAEKEPWEVTRVATEGGVHGQVPFARNL